MKTVYVIRHAKSSWEFPELTDADRPLNDRGRRDAPFMANLLYEQGVKVDKIVSSPALRALTTAIYFSKKFEIKKSELKIEPDIYEAYTGTILRLFQEFENDWNTVFMFGHNPAFTDVLNHFSKNYISNLPTCGIGKIVSDVNDWKDFSPDTASLQITFFPKQYFNN